jgi:hypothetical protein
MSAFYGWEKGNDEPSVEGNAWKRKYSVLQKQPGIETACTHQLLYIDKIFPFFMSLSDNTGRRDCFDVHLNLLAWMKSFFIRFGNIFRVRKFDRS